MEKEEKNVLDSVIKIVLIVIIIILLIHNCTLMKKKEQPTKVPSGNIDIIEITCNNNECEPVNPPIEEISSISFSQSKVSVKKGNTLKLVAIIKPSVLSSSKLTWKSSNPAIASVDENGVVKALKEGTVTITVTSANGKVTTCTVTVTNNNVEVNEVKLNPNKLSLSVGSYEQIKALIYPENATNRNLTWKSSDSSIVTVDSNGVVKALKEGTATITVTSANGKEVICVVTVKNAEVEKVVLNNTKTNVDVGSSVKLNASVLPENAVDKKIIWTSSDESIAIVDSNGNVTGIKEGTVTITATSTNGKKETCVVTVKNVEVKEVIVNPTSASIKLGTTAKLDASVLPENATDKKITWTSSDSSIAAVDNNGNVTGIKEGTVTITATSSNGKVATVKVTVTVDYIPVEKIILDKSETTVKTNENVTIKATVVPENATDKNVIWTSSDENIATADSNGKVTGIKEGTVTITATTIDGSVTATCTVKVEKDYIDDAINVYDKDKSPVKWNGATDLKIFTKSYYTLPGVIAPESEDIYQFEVKNKTAYNLKYDIKFIESNYYNINMQYKLKKNDTYLIDHYVSASELNVSSMELGVNEQDTYYLEWKWVSSSNDTAIGKSADANYGLKIEIDAESIN